MLGIRLVINVYLICLLYIFNAYIIPDEYKVENVYNKIEFLLETLDKV